MRIIEKLKATLRDTVKHNPDVQAAPACILWPDRDRQWQTVLPLLQAELPELLILGDYAPQKRTGPSIWLRCAIAGRLDEIPPIGSYPPILYLPGVGRRDLRAVEDCPEHLKPLAELQYRGVYWSQASTRDWTVLAFLKSDQKGLGLDVAQDNDTKTAMQRVLDRLLDEDPAPLKGKPLTKDYFNGLVSADPVRDLLQWLDQGTAFQASRSEKQWQVFVDVCKSEFDFDPPNEGVLAGASKLAGREGNWQKVWDRFCEAPKRYPNIPEQIGRCPVPEVDLAADVTATDTWPQWNEQQENLLRQNLVALEEMTFHDAGKKLHELEQQHGRRRSLVWAELGKAPLARALEDLVKVADITRKGLAAGTLADIEAIYCKDGWRADEAVVRALAGIKTSSDFEAVSAAIRSIYLAWAEEAARYLQKIVDDGGYPLKAVGGKAQVSAGPGECILFVDGLRYDAGKRLAAMLTRSGFDVSETPAWVALPSVTATGKPAASPVRDKIKGADGNIDFEPEVAGTGQSLKGGHHLKKLLKEAGWTILEGADNGDGKGKAWCEFGNIDHEGHSHGWKMAKNLDDLLKEILARIQGLSAAGWQCVRVVTDHGWLLLPKGLPKIELPGVLADSKWGRCAALKAGASTNERLFAWYWNPDQFFALADGISCYKKGMEYAHGGLSLQECLVLELTVTSGDSAKRAASVQITDVAWKGMRCNVAIEGEVSDLSLDIRSQAANSSTSIVMSVKPFKSGGIGSVIVDDDTLEGASAFIVILNDNSEIVAQQQTVVGGEKI